MARVYICDTPISFFHLSPHFGLWLNIRHPLSVRDGQLGNIRVSMTGDCDPPAIVGIMVPAREGFFPAEIHYSSEPQRIPPAILDFISLHYTPQPEGKIPERVIFGFGKYTDVLYGQETPIPASYYVPHPQDHPVTVMIAQILLHAPEIARFWDPDLCDLPLYFTKNAPPEFFLHLFASRPKGREEYVQALQRFMPHWVAHQLAMYSAVAQYLITTIPDVAYEVFPRPLMDNGRRVVRVQSNTIQLAEGVVIMTRTNLNETLDMEEFADLAQIMITTKREEPVLSLPVINLGNVVEGTFYLSPYMLFKTNQHAIAFGGELTEQGTVVWCIIICPPFARKAITRALSKGCVVNIARRGAYRHLSDEASWVVEILEDIPAPQIPFSEDEILATLYAVAQKPKGSVISFQPLPKQLRIASY